MGLGRRLAIAILLPLALAIAAVFAIAFLVPEALTQRAQEARLLFRLETLRTATEANLALGLPVDEIPATQDLIERAERAEQDLLAIDVFASDGVTLYSTDLGVIGEPVPPAWRAATGSRSPDGRWSLHTEDQTLIGLPVRDDLGETVAEITSVTAAAVLGEPVAELRRTLIGLALWLVPAALTLGALAAGGMARRLARPGIRAAETLRDGGAEAAPGAPARRACLAALAALDRAGADLEAAENA
jgi:hypothetical protein